MKNIFIVGGDGFARECVQYVLWMSEADPEIRFGGFLGHNGYKVDFKSLNEHFICDVSGYEFGPDDYAVIGAGYPELRSLIYRDIKKRNIVLFNLVPPYVRLSPMVEIGEGNIFVPPCAPSPHVTIGNGNLFNGDVIVGHDSEIGDFNFFGGKVQILGDCKIGNMNTVGTASVILPHCRIGSGNKIAPLSAVYKGCKDNCYLQGNPALNVGRVEAESADEG